MLGLRFFACGRCDTVFALPDRPTACASCGSESLEDITNAMADESYFVSAFDQRR